MRSISRTAHPYPVYWPAAYYTYGASVWYNPATGTYGRGSSVYGPYGGYVRGAAYNPTTETWGGSYRASKGYQRLGP